MDTRKKSTFIKLDRSILTWRWYHDGNTFRLFLHLLLNANIKPSSIGEITIGRGEVAVSYMNVANILKLTIQQVRTAFRHLKATGEITITRYSKFSVISIVNFELYQSKQHSLQQSSEQSANNQVTREQHHLKNIRIKELKEIYKALSVEGEELLAAYSEFEIMRVDVKKKPLTDEARIRLVKRVEKMTDDKEKQIELLNTATDSCWLSVWSREVIEKTPEQVNAYQEYIENSILADIEED